MSNKIHSLLIPFIENDGQIKDKNIKYFATTFAGSVLVTKDSEILYSFSEVNGFKEVKRQVLKEKLIGTSRSGIKGEDIANTKINYFIGNNPDDWRKNISTYNLVSLGEVYKGVKVKLRAYGNNVEKLFYVEPEGDPLNIKVKVEGAKSIKLNKDGELELEMGFGPVRFSRPLAYQETGSNKKNAIEVAYNIEENGYSFKVGEYDKKKELIIDPILSATFLGGSSEEYIDGIALDGGGNVYVTGWTSSLDFPGIGTGSADSLSWDVRSEGFVVKLNSDLSAILAATFIGGISYDDPYTLAIDFAGNVYVAGWTYSSDFPGIVPSSSADSTRSEDEGFVVKLNSDLSAILAATFIGGSNDDAIYGLALDAVGNVYVAGNTDSTDFPGIVPGSSADSVFCNSANTCSNEEGFVAKLNSDLSKILAATFIGGTGNDHPSALALAFDFEGVGNVYVAGWTNSTDFPGVGSGSADSTISSEEGFVAKLNSDLSAILAATFIGGTGNDHPSALALDAIGNVYVAGYTDSTDFPGVGSGSADSTISSEEGFVAKLNSDLSAILAATFIGGTGNDYPSALALDGAGNVFVSGYTQSPDFPGIGSGSADSTFGPYYEGFVAKLNSDLSSILAATFIGGNDYDNAYCLALDSTGNVYAAGWTYSTDFPGISLGSADNIFSGRNEGFIVKLGPNLESIGASSGTATLTWDPPTTNSDGTPLADLAGFGVYYGISSGTYNQYVYTGSVTSYTVDNLTSGLTYYFAITAYDTSGNESGYSNEVSKTISPDQTTLQSRIKNYSTSTTTVKASKSRERPAINVVRLTSPNGKENLTSGSSYTITWTTNNTERPIAKVKLFYTKNGGATWKLIDTLPGGNPGTYDWTVPSVTSVRNRCKIRVALKDAKGRTIKTDVSDKFFTIQP